MRGSLGSRWRSMRRRGVTRALGGNGFDVGVQGTPVEDVDDALQAGGALSVGGVLQEMPRE